MSWYDSSYRRGCRDYLTHLLTEVGRLGLTVDGIECRQTGSNGQTVLSDLIAWLSARPGEAFAALFDWQSLDPTHLRSRMKRDRSAKPRIEVSAHITKMNNLSVRWHPGGWRQSESVGLHADAHPYNMITWRAWREPPDFHWFTGDQAPTFDSRPSNELMYIRGVANLAPAPRDDYGPYATYNRDVVDALLICAVRSAYEGLISELECGFEVQVLDAFDFMTRDEVEEGDPSAFRFSMHRVVAWKLEDAAELHARRGREAQAEQERSERAELASIAETHGFSLDALISKLLEASAPKPSKRAPTGEEANRAAAKSLRNAGFKFDAGQVRRIRQLIERYSPEILPEELRPAPSATLSGGSP